MSKIKQKHLNDPDLSDSYKHLLVSGIQDIYVNDDQKLLLETIAEVRTDKENNVSYWINNMEYKLQSQQPPKEWEVVKIKSKLTGQVYKGDRDGHFDHTSIHSVKRLSDGEVFTVGDEVMAGDFISPNQGYKNIINTKITSFYEQSRGMWLRTAGGTWNIKEVVKSKRPLFTTEDGKERFVGDEIWVVRPSLNYGIDFYKLWEGFAHNGLHKIFSTKEAAEEYVLMNKPCLSVKDVANHLQWQIDSYNVIGQFGLKELAKSKMK